MHRDFLSSCRDRFGLPRPLPRPKRPTRRRVGVEALEDRRLLAASLGITTGTLLFQSTGTAMNVRISVDAADVYTFLDPTQPITLGAGTGAWTLSPDGHTATGPASSFTSAAVVGDAGAFNDVVSVDSTKAPLNISTGSGNDSFFLTTQSIAAAVSISNAVSGGSDGDSVFYAVGGVDGTFATGALGRETFLSAAAGAGLISVNSVKPTYASSFPDLVSSGAKLDLNLNSLYATPTALTTRLSLASGVIQVAVTSGPVHSFPDGTVDNFAIGGTTAGSTLTIDYAGGVPYGPGVNFAPPAATGAASNTLILQNGSFAQEAYIASGAGAGRIAFPNRTVGSATISNVVDFSRLSPIIDTVTVAGYTFSAPLGAQTIQVETGPIVSTVQTTRIRSTTNAFEQVALANKGSIGITTGGDADTLAIDLGTPALGLATFSAATAGGDDTIVLLASAAGVATTLDAGAGAANLIDLSNAGSVAGLLGNVFALATGGAATVKLDDSARAVADSFTIAPGRITGGPLGNFLDYSGGGVTTVDVRGGTLSDTFTFTGFGGATTAETYTIAGGPGNDTLVVNSSLPTVNFATGGILSFGAGEPIINYTSIEQVTLNVSATPPVGIPTTIFAVEARPFVQQTVARFTDAAPTGGVSYFAAIDWGDGTPASGGLIVPAGVTGSYDVLGNHSYAAAATYPVTVTVTRQGGGSSGTTVVDGVPITVNSGASESAVVNSTSVVFAAPLAAQGIPLSGRATAPLSTAAGGVQVAAFTDSGTNLDPSAYTALIYWGDGSDPTAATRITAIGTAGGVVYNVFGDHTYAQAGNYPVTVLITKPPVAVAAPATPQSPPGAQVVAVSTAAILPPALTSVAGRLNPASDSGASNSDGITNVVQPTYSGTVNSPGATVAVVAQSPTGPILLGTTQADEAGAWNVTSTVALPDNAYTITIFAGDRYNSGNVITSVLPQTLVIDTFGPKVVAAAFQPSSGSVLVTYQDYGGGGGVGSGVNLTTVQEPSNYAFSFISTTVKGYRPPSQWLVGPIGISPATTFGPQATTLILNGGTSIRGGVYQLVIRSRTSAFATGIQDVAGNALDGEFFGAFPSGNNVAGGDFVARLDSIHNRVFVPGTTVGPGQPRPTPVRPVRPTPVRPVRARALPR
ncbi:beta strand repeat-containing protein [Paludisphaera mucosa]|uniref:Ig-like domain-containing protein n=1 Tax=Paludisphaera mucosa TaxID=3030827 RepID=A0ABT6FEL5_9BACT|nr:Ig-like domain-containing protein [Paludisphaera mucosa]MDG3006021.1 Ig-like domain-containing protein [Paludisphaera mucosa]